jgi:hypothetical protein
MQENNYMKTASSDVKKQENLKNGEKSNSLMYEKLSPIFKDG